jgi:hypothetical protein
VSEPQLEQFAETIEVPLEPLRCMKGLSAVEQQVRWRELRRVAQRRYPQLEGPVLGADRALALDPQTRPKKTKRSPAPRCHASTAEARALWMQMYANFVAAYRNAWQRLRANLGKRPMFPEGGVPPTWPDAYAFA